jgi:protein involved in polysaccharide export with SLBB domain
MTSQTRLFLIGCAIFTCSGVMAQSRLEAGIPDLLGIRQDAKTGLRSQVDARNAVPMDAPLDATEYTVGPGDVLALNIWSAAPSEHQLTVTPEALLLVPAVGSVDVRELSLDAVRTRLLPMVQRKYPGAQVTLALVAPRKVSVRITGQVMNEGMLEMSSVQRVDHLISAANSLPPTQTTKEFYTQELPMLRYNASERLISIRRRDGSVRQVDLVKFRITGESRYNPYLREGDMVYVPPRKTADNNIGVMGAVVGPTNVEFVAGDSLKDLIRVGFGLKPLADPTHSLLARESLQGGMDTVRVDVAAILEGRAPDLALQPGDRLVVPEQPETRAGDFVTVEGAVGRPGRYPITSERTTLRDLLRLCGGFSDDANPLAATLVRMPTEDLYQIQLSTRNTEVAQDSAYYAMETALRLRGEMVSVNLRGLFVQKDSACDVTLRNRDRFTVPSAQRNIYVFGQVVRPGHVPYVPGKGYRHYVDRASGFTELARTGNVKIIKAGSRVWLDPDETEVEDGDMIWVPKEITYPFSYYLSTAVQIAGIIGTAITLIVLLDTVK